LDTQFGSYREFFPYYVAMHSQVLTRRLHFFGTVLGLILTSTGLVTGRRKLLPALPLLGYGFAWPSHWLIEGNNPASFGHPLWSLRGDFEMIAMMIKGRDGELTVLAKEWLAEHPEHRTGKNYREPLKLVA
jgi:hypothetical protein